MPNGWCVGRRCVECTAERSHPPRTPTIQHLDSIAVRDTNHAAGEVGEGRGDEQKNDDEDEKEYPLHFLGFHSRARRCASSICADDIWGASRSRASEACLTPCAAARLNHMCACT